MKIKILFFLFVFILLSNDLSFAHKVNVFANHEDGVLSGEGYYGNGHPAQNSLIEIFDSQENNLLGQTKTNEDGVFSMDWNKVGTFKIVMNAGQGHRGEFIIEIEKNLSENKSQRIVPGKKMKMIMPERRRGQLPRFFPSVGRIIIGIASIIGIFNLIYKTKKKNAL